VVNENDIRIRAYFHFANRTGRNWQDPTSNLDPGRSRRESAGSEDHGHYRRTLHVSPLVATHSDVGCTGDRCEGRKWSDCRNRPSCRTQAAANSLAFIWPPLWSRSTTKLRSRS
jgi:hypothetical protein